MVTLLVEPIRETLELKLRQKDENECWLSGAAPQEAIWASAMSSLESWVVYANGVPVAVWGYGIPALTSNWCHAWLLTTPEIENYKYRLGRCSIRAMARLLQMYRGVRVAVDPDYEESVVWLTWLGFQIIGKWDGFYIMSLTLETFPWGN